MSILTPSAIVQRNRIIDTLLYLSSVRFEGTQPYIAVPRLLCATLDCQTLKNSGIGLILYDDRRIEEVTKPEPIRGSTTTLQEQSVPKKDPRLVDELVELRSLYAELKRNIASMRDEINSTQPNAFTPITASRTCSDEHYTIQRPAATIISSEDELASLPSFFTNNPWLDVLSKRGRGEAPLLAG